MADLLIRDFPGDDLARLDALASALGLSRAEYIRRRLTQDARRNTVRITVDELRALGEDCRDLLDEEVMRRAWS